MFRAQRTASIAIMMALDAAALLAAFFIVWQLRAGLGEVLIAGGKLLGYNTSDWVRHAANVPRGTYDFQKIVISRDAMENTSKHLWVLYFSLLSWGALLYFQKGYDVGNTRNTRQEFALCAYTGILGTISLLAFMGLLQLSTSRLFIVGLLIVGVLVLWATRVVVAPLARRASRPRRNVLLIGSSQSAQRYRAMLRTPAYQWSRLIGYVSDDKPEVALPLGADPDAPIVSGRRAADIFLGTIEQLPRVLDDHIIDEVILVRATSENGVAHNWGDVLELCLERGRTVSLVDDSVPPVNAKVEASMMGQMPVLVMHNTPQNPLPLAIKNVMDRVLAGIMLIVLAPLFAVMALLIKRHDGGPIFYSQKRVGLNGRLFNFYKFRSMDVNAAEILEKLKLEDRAYYDSINVMEEPFFKAPDDKDPRITPIGRFIRKYSIDELPQFWNVFKGDMSLVGPRPPLPKEVAELAPVAAPQTIG